MCISHKKHNRTGAARKPTSELEGLPLLGVPATAHAGQQRYARPRDRGSGVQRDWEEREFAQSIQLGIKSLAQFLNEFGLR